MIYKGINLSISEIKEKIEEFLSSKFSEYKVIKEEFENGYQFIISVPDQEKALLNVCTSKKGFTIDPNLGKNQKLSNEIAKFIASASKEIKLTTQILNDISENLFSEFLSNLDKFGATKEKYEERKDHKYLKLKNKFNQTVICQYYPSSRKLLVQGYETKLLRNILVWFIDNVILGQTEEKREIVFNTEKDFEKYNVIFPDKLLEEKLKERIGGHYLDSRFIDKAERKWLKVSYYLLEFEKDLPDYYACISASIKVLEGILKRFLLRYCGYTAFYKGGEIKVFYYDEENDRWLLKEKWRKRFKKEESIKFLENLYNLYKRLERYTVNNGIIPSITEISEYKKAKNIFAEILNVLREVEKIYVKDKENEENKIN